MASSENFDKYPHINYQPLERLYWGEFSHRVSIEMPLARRKRFRSVERLKAAVQAMLDRIDYADMEVVYRTNHVGHNFFFTDARQAAAFIDRNADQITAVVRPQASDDLSRLADPNVSFRSTAFFDRYVWRLTLKVSEESSEAIQHIRSTLYDSDLLPFDNARHDRMHWSRNRLYLRDEEDMLLVRLGVDDEHICSLDQIVVR